MKKAILLLFLLLLKFLLSGCSTNDELRLQRVLGSFSEEAKVWKGWVKKANESMYFEWCLSDSHRDSYDEYSASRSNVVGYIYGCNLHEGEEVAYVLNLENEIVVATRFSGQESFRHAMDVSVLNDAIKKSYPHDVVGVFDPWLLGAGSYYATIKHDGIFAKFAWSSHSFAPEGFTFNFLKKASEGKKLKIKSRCSGSLCNDKRSYCALCSRFSWRAKNKKK